MLICGLLPWRPDFLIRCRAASAWRLPLFLCLGALTAGAAADAEYLIELQDRARQLNLHLTRNWMALGHYDVTRQAWRSRVDSAPFFRAEDGPVDPWAEMQATLAAFFDPRPLPGRDEPAQCAYRARFQFLSAALEFDPARLPILSCARYQSWRESLDVAQVAVVFPAAYLNSPASMFGHSLLRLDAATQDSNTRLLAYAVNFAADTRESQGLRFAIKGVSGQYAGEFGLYPYYDKVKSYARIENRDLWEYSLNLDSVAIDRLLAHLWELRTVRFDYFFFDENCSFQLLALLEAARPDLRLTPGFKLWALPTDTIRRLQEQDGLVGSVTFRPALRTGLDQRIADLSVAEEVALNRFLLQGRSWEFAGADLSATSRAKVLEIGHDWLYYHYRSGGGERGDLLERAHHVLAARAALGGTVQFAPARQPAVGPTQGHASRRAHSGVALRRAAHSTTATLHFGLRPAFHDLLDPAAGYLPGAQIEFFNLDLGYLPDRQRLQVERFVALDIQSIVRRDAYFRPWSWRVAAGLRRDAPGVVDPLLAFVEAAPGLAYGFRGITVYGFIQAELRADDGVPKGYSYGGGPQLGALWQASSRWQLEVRAHWLERWPRPNAAVFETRIGGQWNTAADWGLRTQWLYRRDGSRPSSSLKLELLRYF